MGINLSLSERKCFALAAVGIGCIQLFGLLPSIQLGGLMIIGGLVAYKLEDQKEKKIGHSSISQASSASSATKK